MSCIAHQSAMRELALYKNCIIIIIKMIYLILYIMLNNMKYIILLVILYFYSAISRMVDQCTLQDI